MIAGRYGFIVYYHVLEPVAGGGVGLTPRCHVVAEIAHLLYIIVIARGPEIDRRLPNPGICELLVAIVCEGGELLLFVFGGVYRPLVW